MNTSTPIINKLREASIVEFEPDSKEIASGKIKIIDLCDYYFTITLTKDEMYQLSKEIKLMADLL